MQFNGRKNRISNSKLLIEFRASQALQILIPQLPYHLRMDFLPTPDLVGLKTPFNSLMIQDTEVSMTFQVIDQER